MLRWFEVIILFYIIFLLNMIDSKYFHMMSQFLRKGEVYAQKDSIVNPMTSLDVQFNSLLPILEMYLRSHECMNYLTQNLTEKTVQSQDLISNTVRITYNITGNQQLSKNVQYFLFREKISRQYADYFNKINDHLNLLQKEKIKEFPNIEHQLDEKVLNLVRTLKVYESFLISTATQKRNKELKGEQKRIYENYFRDRQHCAYNMKYAFDEIERYKEVALGVNQGLNTNKYTHEESEAKRQLEQTTNLMNTMMQYVIHRERFPEMQILNNKVTSPLILNSYNKLTNALNNLFNEFNHLKNEVSQRQMQASSVTVSTRQMYQFIDELYQKLSGKQSNSGFLHQKMKIIQQKVSKGSLSTPSAIQAIDMHSDYIRQLIQNCLRYFFNKSKTGNQSLISFDFRVDQLTEINRVIAERLREKKNEQLKDLQQLVDINMAIENILERLDPQYQRTRQINNLKKLEHLDVLIKNIVSSKLQRQRQMGVQKVMNNANQSLCSRIPYDLPENQKSIYQNSNISINWQQQHYHDRKALEEKQFLIKNQKRMIDGLQQTKMKLKGLLATIQQGKRKLERQNQHLIKAKQSQNQRLKEDIYRKNTQNQNLKLQLIKNMDIFQIQTTKLKQENLELNNQKTTNRQQNQQLKDKNILLSNQMNIMNQDVIDLNKKIKLLESEQRNKSIQNPDIRLFQVQVTQLKKKEQEYLKEIQQLRTLQSSQQLLRAQLQVQVQLLSCEKGQISIKLSNLQKIHEELKTKIKEQENQFTKLEQKNKQLESRVHESEEEISKLTINQKQQKRDKLQQEPQLEIKNGQLIMVPYTQTLFNDDLFFRDEYNKEKLISHLQKYGNSKITRTSLVHKYDPRNKANFHQYIDNVKNLCLIIRTPCAIIAGFYPGVFKEKEVMNKGGLLISVTNDKSYQLFAKKPGDNKTIFRGMIYDEYYAIFGNAEIRIKVGFKLVFSNFGINNSFYNSQGDKVDKFLNEGDRREVEFLNCEFYQLFFERDKMNF